MEMIGSTNNGANAAAQTQKTVGKDEFLRLFVTQLRFQDPLSPMDSSQFTAQLAQFSSLEQLTNIDKSLNNLVLYQSSIQNTLSADLIGREVGFVPTGGATPPPSGGGLSRGLVTGVTFEDGKTWLIVEGAGKISPGDIREIR